MSYRNHELKIDRVVTRGCIAKGDFCLDLENNVWVIGDERECIIIDASHEDGPIIQAVNNRQVLGVYFTHAHNDHINRARELFKEFSCPLYLHPADDELWRETFDKSSLNYQTIPENESIRVSNQEIKIINTPGHTPGSRCFYQETQGILFTGDTLFPGGPGATQAPYSNFDTIIDSIRNRLFVLPPDTIIHPGHGASTKIKKEKPFLDNWIARGY